MKVRYLLFFVLLAFSQLSQGQILVGPVVGGNVSWVSFGDKENKDLYKVNPVVGYHAGMQVSFRVEKRFFLHTSLLYSTKGKVVKGKLDKLLDNRVTYRYIEMPILYTAEFKTRLGGGKEYNWYLGIGPNVSYWLGAKGTFFNSEVDETMPAVDEIKYTVVFNKNIDALSNNEMNIDDPNRLQLGLNFAAGLVFEPIRDQTFMLTLRYELGHSYLSKTHTGYIPVTIEYQDTPRTRNQGLRLSIAYLLDTKIKERKKGKSTIKKKNR